MGGCHGECVDGAWEDWQAWSPCSASCNGGTRFRKRRIAKMATSCGEEPQGNDRETEFCSTVSCEPPVDCELSDWSPWSACSANCSGVKNRSRTIETYGRGDGVWCKGALKEIHPCNPKSDDDCGVVLPVDCVLSDWNEWNECSATCGGGQHVREREIDRHPVGRGKTCDDPLSEIRECSPERCSAGPPAIDCQVGDWQDWGACSKCSGERTRSREITTFAANGGTPCEAFDAGEVGKCPRECGHQAFCIWDSWSNWGACTASCGTGGKRRRSRSLMIAEKNETEELLAVHVTQKYEVLYQRTQDLEASHVQEVALAYVCGCLSLVVVAAVARGRQALRARGGIGRRSASAYGSPSDMLNETELPLVASSEEGAD